MPQNYILLIKLVLKQGILSIPGIAGYECVPARIGHFYQ